MTLPLENSSEETASQLEKEKQADENSEGSPKSQDSVENNKEKSINNGSQTGEFDLGLDNPSGGRDKLNGTGIFEQDLRADIPYFEFKSNSFADFICLLPNFSGTDEDFTIKDFIERVEEIATLQNWEDKHVILAVKLKLLGEAAIYAKLHPAIRRATTKQEVYTELKNRFGKVGDKNKILRLTQATQKPTENCRSFLSRLSGLAFKCFPNEDAVRERMLYNQALKGIDAQSRRFIMAQNLTNYQEIWEAALQEEKCDTYEKSQVEINMASSGWDKKNSDLDQMKALFQMERAENDKKFAEFTEQMRKLVLDNTKINTPATSPPQTPYQTLQQPYFPQQQYYPQQPYFPPMPVNSTQYPQFRPQSNFANNNQRTPRNNIICHNCGKRGHVQKQCWFKNRPQDPQQNRGNLN